MNPAMATVMDGKVKRPDPYTEVHYHAEGGATARQRVIGFVLLVLAVGSGFGAVKGWTLPAIGAWHAIEVLGSPLVLWLGGVFVVYHLGLMAGTDPVRLKREVRHLAGAANLGGFWDASLSCRICSGPLVPDSQGLRCRECGRGHTHLGTLRESDTR